MLAGGQGRRRGPPVKIFRGRQKLEKGAKKFITNNARTPFFGRNSEFGKTE